MVATSNRDLWVLPLAAERKPQPFFPTPFEETAGMFSPNGRWLAYVSNESGRLEVSVNGNVSDLEKLMNDPAGASLQMA